ncbi:MAG TPA: hypothetical protein VMT93_02185 [Gemmatimonadaceae bacterium]|nr:hypothetical protein [Gemmatimonadaceae bacterium]
MTVGEWLATRAPAPPENLAERLRRALGPSLERDQGETVIACLDALEALLVDLRDDPEAGRERALDLLAADALVTYAFEAAGEEPLTLMDVAKGAMWRVGEVAAELET